MIKIDPTSIDATTSARSARSANLALFNLALFMDHASALYKSDRAFSHLYPTMILSLSVLDAPILLVNSPREASDPVLTPWIRVTRQETKPDLNRIRYLHYVVDVVHVDFFDMFISDHLEPFVDQLVSRTQRQSEVLLNGGVVEDLDNWRWDQISPSRQK